MSTETRLNGTGLPDRDLTAPSKGSHACCDRAALNWKHSFSSLLLVYSDRFQHCIADRVENIKFYIESMDELKTEHVVLRATVPPPTITTELRDYAASPAGAAGEPFCSDELFDRGHEFPQHLLSPSPTDPDTATLQCRAFHVSACVIMFMCKCIFFNLRRTLLTTHLNGHLVLPQACDELLNLREDNLTRFLTLSYHL